MVEQAGALSIALDAESLGTLRDLEPVLAAIAAAEEHRARLAAWEAARKDALRVLDRVIGRSSTARTGAAGAHRVPGPGARAARDARRPGARGARATRRSCCPSKTRPYTELLALVEGWNVLDDDRCAVLQDAITESFGRSPWRWPRSAASSGARARRRRPRRASRARPRPPTRAPSWPPPEPVPSLRAPMAPGGRRATARRADAPVVATAAEPAARSRPRGRGGAAAGRPGPGDAAARRRRHRPGRGVRGWPTRRSSSLPAPPTRRPAGEPRARVATPSRSRRRRRAASRRSSSSGSPRRPPAGGSRARAGWHGLRERGLTFGDAAHDYLKRFPYLLSVPLQKSAEYEGGRLAEGYALLLAHIDKQEEGFVRGRARAPESPVRHPGQGPDLSAEPGAVPLRRGRGPALQDVPGLRARGPPAHGAASRAPWVQGGIVDGRRQHARSSCARSGRAAPRSRRAR